MQLFKHCQATLECPHQKYSTCELMLAYTSLPNMLSDSMTLLYNIIDKTSNSYKLTNNWYWVKSNYFVFINYTVKPVYNSHLWDHANVAAIYKGGLLIEAGERLVVH